MPGVKLLHQQSESNNKPEYIMGHSLQAVSLLVHAAASVFAVPLAIRIHDGRGVVQSRPPYLARQDARPPRHRRHRATLLLRRRRLLCRAQERHRLAQRQQPPGHPGEVQRRRLHPHQQRGPRKRGRPKIYDRKVKPKSLLQDSKGREQAKNPVYGERQVVIQYKVRDLLWRPAGRLVRFVAVIHPTRGSCLLMCTDTSLAAIEIIRLYGLRFKIDIDQAWRLSRIGGVAVSLCKQQRPAVPRRRRRSDSPQCADRLRIGLHQFSATNAGLHHAAA